MARAFNGGRSALSVLVIVGVALAWAGAAQPPAQSTAARPAEAARAPQDARQSAGGAARPDPRNVEGAMKLINRSLRQLNAQVGDTAKKEENLKLINDAQRGAVIAKGLEPEAAPKDDGRAKYLKEFRRHQIKLVRMLLDLEVSVMNDKADEAKEHMAKLAAYRDESHEEFEVEDEGNGKGWEEAK